MPPLALTLPQIGRPLILVTAAIAAFASISIIKNDEHHNMPAPVPALALSIFSLLLLLKIALNVLLYHYGFALALPGLALAIVAATCWIPGWLNRRGGRGAFVRGAATVRSQT